jgi:hypothetical protein
MVLAGYPAAAPPVTGCSYHLARGPVEQRDTSCVGAPRRSRHGWRHTTQRTSVASTRRKRERVLGQVLENTSERDAQRLFNATQRRITWHASADETCSFCEEPIRLIGKTWRLTAYIRTAAAEGRTCRTLRSLTAGATPPPALSGPAEKIKRRSNVVGIRNTADHPPRPSKTKPKPTRTPTGRVRDERRSASSAHRAAGQPATGHVHRAGRPHPRPVPRRVVRGASGHRPGRRHGCRRTGTTCGCT